VIANSTVLDQSGLDAFQNYMQSGGNFVGVHSASACLQESSFFNQTVGGMSVSHYAPIAGRHTATRDSRTSDRGGLRRDGKAGIVDVPRRAGRAVYHAAGSGHSRWTVDFRITRAAC
jgi:hypothetical protein